MRRRARLLALVVLVLVVAACTSDAAPGAAGSSSSASGPFVLRLGTSPDTAQAPALTAITGGGLARHLGSTPFQPNTYAVSADALNEIATGIIDAAYVDPVSALAIIEKAKGRRMHLVAGSTSGGWALVVKAAVLAPADLKGKTIGVPGFGSTADVLFRSYLEANGLKGEVDETPVAPSDALTSFQQGKIDGAWLPEPWATQLVTSGAAHVLTTDSTTPSVVVVVADDVIAGHRTAVQALVDATGEAIAGIAGTESSVHAEIERQSGATVPPVTYDAVRFSPSLDTAALTALAQRAVSYDILHSADVTAAVDGSFRQG